MEKVVKICAIAKIVKINDLGENELEVRDSASAIVSRGYTKTLPQQEDITKE